LGIAAITVSALAVVGVFSSQRSQASAPQVTPVPDVIGMTKDGAVRTLEAAHLRPVTQFTQHAKGRPSGIVVAALSGSHPISVGGGHSVGVASEGDQIPLIVSR
jgi:beta-lactam-binding protein with PASTA domain